MSLHGQLFFREFFYLVSSKATNFDKMLDNPRCKQVNWSSNKKFLDAWENGMTGFPAIDATMRQLKQEGWIHHLGRHLVACFLTRGDLWVHWELGAKVFEKHLLDADWALNNANW
jgi:cryptochrome